MADKDQRTEEATPKRREKLREEGKVAKSQDVATAVTLLAVLGGLGASLDRLAREMSAFADRIFRMDDRGQLFAAVGAAHALVIEGLTPVLAVSFLGAFAVGVVQTRGLFVPSLAAPKLERLNPLPNLKKLVPSKEYFTETGKQLLKLTAVGWVTYGLIRDATPRFALLASVEPEVAIAEVASVARRLGLRVALAFCAIAALDWYLMRRKFNEDAKMSHQEVRDERKQQDGDPAMKGKRRAKMREMARLRAQGGVKDATVLITNPTHVSVALRYDAEKDAAPTVLAKGLDEVALSMRIEARQHRIPIVENRPLARALHASAQLGKPIPVDLYKAAAQVIAHVFSLRKGAA